MSDLVERLRAAAEGEEHAYFGDVSLLHKEAADEIERLEGQWQPIGTAPKTSQSRLVYCPDRQNIYCVTWNTHQAEGGWLFFGGMGRLVSEVPSHWMPLPTPPAKALSDQPERQPPLGR